MCVDALEGDPDQIRGAARALVALVRYHASRAPSEPAADPFEHPRREFTRNGTRYLAVFKRPVWVVYERREGAWTPFGVTRCESGMFASAREIAASLKMG